MNRRELVRRLVLDTVCDDYENIDQIILPLVAETGAKCGLQIERAELVEALAGLIEDELVKGYILSAWEPHCLEVNGMPDVHAIEQNFKTYFFVTGKGMERYKSDTSWWPLDEEENLRTGRALDSAD